ncbi:hypothetical protein [Streptosporangium amethystogenes]|uniref:hypothetical protein n=1 Tax=Streptosporangium amethystogenes TaxID=2002 RepID=UPI0012F98572|nr:hypothetical protein [Streptosporangium amethystogenes]
MSRQTAFTLMLLLAFSVIVPGSAGYLSVKMEAIDQAHQDLLTLESRLRHEKLAARIKRMERVNRARHLQPVTPSGREASEPVRSSRVESGTPPPGPGTVVAVPIRPGAEWPRERRPRAQRQSTQRPGTAWQNPQGLEAQGPPEAQGPTAQRHVETGTAGTAEAAGGTFTQERWSQLERRGRVRQYRERLADAGPVFTTPDPIGGENPGEGTGESLEENLLPQLSQTETRAN